LEPELHYWLTVDKLAFWRESIIEGPHAFCERNISRDIATFELNATSIVIAI
jgi:hypothetical protein